MDSLERLVQFEKPGFRKAWPWVVALFAYDYGDRKPLADRIASSEPIPAEFRPALSEIVMDKRRPNMKAASKMKIPAGEYMKVAGAVETILALLDVLKSDAQSIADEKAVEPLDIIRLAEQEQRKLINSTANRHSVSTETIENMLRELRHRYDIWPTV